MNKLLFLLLLFAPLLNFAQSKKQKKAMEAQLKADQIVLNNLKSHVQFLSKDELEGRKAGSTGEQMAREYIMKAFAEIGLQPKGSSDFVQKFVIEEGRQIDTSTRFILNNTALKLNQEYFPLAYSANKSSQGIPALDLKEAGEPWFADVKDWLDPSKGNSNLNDAIKKEALRVSGKGATALILYNSTDQPDKIVFDKLDSTPALPIPVIYLTSEAFKKYCSDRSALLEVDLNVALKEGNRYGSNVIGYLNNGATTTVVIGAHYDHLGTMSGVNTADPATDIMNGADDNASGTAALIELARLLKTSTFRQNNYLFIAFSAEESNMMGSKYWLEHPTLESGVNYMINLDMVGRYDASRRLTVGGYASSPAFSTLFATVKDNTLAVKLDSSFSATGDHTAFYNNNIPALYFFTGSHADYHKPTDDWDKINYDGELRIVKLLQKLVETADNQGKLAFTSLPEPLLAPSARYTVSLGVVPDNGYNGKGFKIGGVSPKRLAEKIGLQPGDILLQLGDYKINEMSSYLKALSMFKQGDSTTLKVLRGNDEKQIAVNF